MTTSITKEEVLSSLNDEQREVAEYHYGPCFTIAGPGGGNNN